MAEQFQTTRWKTIRDAAMGEEGIRDKAWQEFDRDYREPLLGYICRQNWSREEAKDLLQSFYAKLVTLNWLNQADEKRGKMRTFLLCKLKGHLSDARKFKNAEKRGGGRENAPLDTKAAPYAQTTDSDLEFDRDWAQTILDRALTNLRSESEGKGQGEVYRLFRSQLTGDSPEKLRAIAVKLGESEEACRMQLHRLRVRFRKLLRAEVAETLLPGDDVSEEMRYLARVLA